LKNNGIIGSFCLIIIVSFFCGCFFDDDELPTVTEYPFHTDIIATTFSILSDRDDLSSGITAWQDTTEINLWYCALPFNNRTFKFYYDKGYRPEYPYSYAQLATEVKNRWVEVYYQGITAYCQWEDVGPWFFEDYKYVFDPTGKTRPRAESRIGQKIDKGYLYSQAGVREPTVSEYYCNGAGIDLSPETMGYLTGTEENHITGVRWRFVREAVALAADPMGLYWAESVNRRPTPPLVFLNHVSGRD